VNQFHEELELTTEAASSPSSEAPNEPGITTAQPKEPSPRGKRLVCLVAVPHGLRPWLVERRRGADRRMGWGLDWMTSLLRSLSVIAQEGLPTMSSRFSRKWSTVRDAPRRAGRSTTPFHWT